MNGNSMEGRVALVTGGTSGIGLGISQALLRAGCAVTATGLLKSEVDEATQNLPDLNGRVLDVTDQQAVTACVSSFTRLDIVVNCAGMILRGGAELQPENFERVIDVNLNGTMRVCSASHPLLSVSRGCIVNLASMLSFFGSAVAPGYSSSKGGVSQLTKSLAMAWADDGIRVNAVAPGWITTPLTKALTDDPSRRQAIINRTPLKRWGTPEDVAGAVLFLCSDAAAFVTGVILPVDGGYSIA